LSYLVYVKENVHKLHAAIPDSHMLHYFMYSI